MYPAFIPTLCLATCCMCPIQESMSISGINLQQVCANIRSWYLSIIHRVLLCLFKSKCVSPWKQPCSSTRGCWFQRPCRHRPIFPVWLLLLNFGVHGTNSVHPSNRLFSYLCLSLFFSFFFLPQSHLGRGWACSSWLWATGKLSIFEHFYFGLHAQTRH